MRLYLLAVLLLISGLQTANSQKVSYEVNINTPDLHKLEWFTYEFVNELRREKHHSNLVWDVSLYKAAQDHANYLIKEKDISHFQKIKGKRTPADRVKLYSGPDYTTSGENISSVPMGTQVSIKGYKKSTITYQSAASTIAKSWRESPGHYKNLLSDGYNCTALATAYDTVSQRLVAVQVFGFTKMPQTPLIVTDYSADHLRLRTPKLPHGLKAYRYKTKNQKAARSFLRMSFDRGYLTGSYRTAKKTFKGRRSGIVQEFVPLSQFDIGSPQFTAVPNRRNGLHELNGELVKPIYRKELLKYSRKNTARDYYVYTKWLRIKKPTRLFVYPLQDYSRDVNTNLFLVKNKRLECFMIPIAIPAALFDVQLPALTIVNGFKPTDNADNFKIVDMYDTLHFQIFYAPGEVTIDLAKQYEIKKAFDGFHGKIVAVEGEAYASIEGYESSNDKLAAERMKYFMSLASPYLDTITIVPQLVTLEQENLFYKQISGTRLNHLAALGIDDVRNYVNKNKQDTLLVRLLGEGRYTKIKVISHRAVKEYQTVKKPLDVYYSLKQEFEKHEKPKQSLINDLVKAQLAVYDDLSHSLGNTTLDIPHLKRYPVFEYHDLVFQYSVLKTISDKAFYDSLHNMAKSRYLPNGLKAQMVYNNLALINKAFVGGTLEDLMDLKSINCRKFRQAEFHLRKFNKLKCQDNSGKGLDSEYYVLKEMPAFIASGKKQQLENFPEDELWKYYYVHTINLLYNQIPLPREIYTMLPGFKNQFHPNDEKLTEEERLKYGYFYAAMNRHKTAMDLVVPLAARTSPNLEALKFYLTLKFERVSNDRKFEKLLIKELPRLGKLEWCDLMLNPRYLNFLLLEDLKVRSVYQCNCLE